MITEREKELLEYIIEFKKVNGYAPTVREMQKGINTNSKNHIGVMLDNLKDKGYITNNPHKPRTIKVIRFLNR